MGREVGGPRKALAASITNEIEGGGVTYTSEAWNAKHAGITLNALLENPTWNLIQAITWIVYRNVELVSI